MLAKPIAVRGRVVALALVLAACGSAGEGDSAQLQGGTSGSAASSSADASTQMPPSVGGSGAQSTDVLGTSSSSAAVDSGSTAASDPSAASSTGSSTIGSSTGEQAELGDISGGCGVLDLAALTGEEPGFVLNTLDFGELGFDYDRLTPGGQAVFDAGNLGGSSLFSEVISFDVLARCEAAELLKTETEIEYVGEGTRTDLLVAFDGTKIGVSVTRGQGFPLDDPYSVQQAQALLEDKLSDIPMSTANVAPQDAWEKQILHVIAYGPMHAQSLQTAYDALGPEFTLDTLVVVTVTDGDDLFIYTE